MDDGDVKALVAEIMDRNPPYPMLYRAGLFGERCMVYQPVLVPVDPAQHGTVSRSDLMTHFWLDDISWHIADLVADEDWLCTKITSVWGTDIILERPFSLYTRPRREPGSQPNTAIQNLSRGKCVWYGNVLVIKHSRRDSVSHIAAEEGSLVKLAVLRALQSGTIPQTTV